MANQTQILNVSDEMKLNDNVQMKNVKEQEENMYSSSSDTTEELCSSSTTDACGDGCSDAVLWKIRKIGVLDQLILGLIQMQIKECGSTFGEKYERDI